MDQIPKLVEAQRDPPVEPIVEVQQQGIPGGIAGGGKKRHGFVGFRGQVQDLQCRLFLVGQIVDVLARDHVLQERRLATAPAPVDDSQCAPGGVHGPMQPPLFILPVEKWCCHGAGLPLLCFSHIMFDKHMYWQVPTFMP